MPFTRENLEMVLIQTEHWLEIGYCFFNPFHVTGLFLYPLKTSKNSWFVQGVQKETSSMK